MWEVEGDRKDEVIVHDTLMGWNLAVRKQFRGHPCCNELSPVLCKYTWYIHRFVKQNQI